MTSHLPIPNIANGRVAYVKSATEYGGPHTAGKKVANVADIVGAEYRIMMRLSPRIATILAGMSAISLWCLPLKIVPAVVRLVRIAVINLDFSATIFGWRWRQESEGNEGMYHHRPVFFVQTKGDKKIAVAISLSDHLCFTSSTGAISPRNRSYLSFIAYLVRPLDAIADDFFPSHRITLPAICGGRMA